MCRIGYYLDADENGNIVEKPLSELYDTKIITAEEARKRGIQVSDGTMMVEIRKFKPIKPIKQKAP
jgi:hypothetical protein